MLKKGERQQCSRRANPLNITIAVALLLANEAYRPSLDNTAERMLAGTLATRLGQITASFGGVPT